MKPKQEDFEISGPGVAAARHKDLDRLGDQLSDLREKKSELAEQITGVESRALERMTELGLSSYRFRDREMSVKPGNAHVKIKEVKVGNGNGADEEEEAE